MEEEESSGRMVERWNVGGPLVSEDERQYVEFDHLLGIVYRTPLI